MFSAPRCLQRPRLCLRPLRNIPLYVSLLSFSETDLIQALQQASLAERVIRKGKLILCTCDGLVFQINHNLSVLRQSEQAVDLLLRQFDEENAVFERVAGEDVREARRNDRAYTHVSYRPDGMFARGATTEIVACDEYARASSPRAIKTLSGSAERSVSKANCPNPRGS